MATNNLNTPDIATYLLINRYLECDKLCTNVLHRYCIVGVAQVHLCVWFRFITAPASPPAASSKLIGQPGVNQIKQSR